MTTLDIVFEGGGARGLALNGAVAALEAAGYSFGRLVGTSAGAITATLAAAGYSGAQLRALSTEKNALGASRMTEFVGTPRGFSDDDLRASLLGRCLAALDLPLVPEALERRLDQWLMHKLIDMPAFAHVYSLVEHGGFFSADGFVAWLSEKLEAVRPGSSKMSLGQFHELTGKHLSLVVTDTTQTGFLVLNHLTAPDCPVVWAVRMSMSIPFFWPEVLWLPAWGDYRGKADVVGNALVDGGVVSNFALRFLVSDEDWIVEIMGGPPDPEASVLGLWLDDRAPVPGAPPSKGMLTRVEPALLRTRVLARVERVVNAALSANDVVEMTNHAQLVCRLPTAGYGVTEFDMSTERIDALMTAAGKATQAWLDAHGAPPTVRDAKQALSSLAP